MLEEDPNARDYFRYFEAPGVEHCFGGPGAYPGEAFKALVGKLVFCLSKSQGMPMLTVYTADWVEHGKAPETLQAATLSMDPTAAVKTRPLCQYPQVAAYVGGDPDNASSFKCADSFGSKKASEFVRHAEL